MRSGRTIKERALELGFDLAGIAPLEVWRDLEFSRQWVEKGFNGEMRYLENPKRFDPLLVLPSAKSVICVGLVYNAPLPYSTEVGQFPVSSFEFQFGFSSFHFPVPSFHFPVSISQFPFPGFIDATQPFR